MHCLLSRQTSYTSEPHSAVSLLSVQVSIQIFSLQGASWQRGGFRSCPLVFVVWMSLINRGESKQACPVGLMRGESSGVIKGKSLSQQKYLNQQFTALCFTAGAHRCGPAAWHCSDTCEPERGAQAQVTAVCSVCCIPSAAQSEYMPFDFGNGHQPQSNRHMPFKTRSTKRQEIERKERLIQPWVNCAHLTACSVWTNAACL